MARSQLSSAALSARARKAAQTKRRLAEEDSRRRRAGLPPMTPAERSKFARTFGATSGQSHAAAPTNVSATSTPPTPTPSPVVAAPGGGAASIASRLQGVAATAPQQTSTEPDVDAALRASALLVQPTWEIDGKWFRCWQPGSLKKVQLPIEPKPGPFTPTEEVHPVLGAPQMLFAICVAIAENEASLLYGPTGVAKTMVYRWLAKQLNWNFVAFPMHKDIASEDLVGEYKPFEGKSGEMILRWSWGMVSKAVLASQEHPTLGVFEEINRVGNMQVFARLYSLLDDTRQLVIDEKGAKDGALGEVLQPGKLYFGANMNPADAGDADYIGVQSLDPALARRFSKHVEVKYPDEAIEAEALRRRVKGLGSDVAARMVKVATAIRNDPDLRFPISFPDLMSWATGLPYYGWEQAAEVAVISKAHPDYQAAIRDLVLLNPTARGARP